MTVHGDALLAILLMGAVTYALRAGGFWLMGRVTISPRMEAALAYLPGSVITALVVPATIEAGIPGIGAVAVIALVSWKRPGLLLALLLGLGTVVLLRFIFQETIGRHARTMFGRRLPGARSPVLAR